MRPIRANEASAARALIETILAEYNLSPDPAGADADLVDPGAYYAERGGVFWVLLDRQTIIATVGVIPLPGRVVELRKMYLQASYRGSGQGRRLLQHAMDWARDRGFRTLRLESASCLKEAVALYESTGFRKVKVCNSVCRCDLVMELDLTASATGPQKE
jgi:putative acetyltransferase